MHVYNKNPFVVTTKVEIGQKQYFQVSLESDDYVITFRYTEFGFLKARRLDKLDPDALLVILKEKRPEAMFFPLHILPKKQSGGLTLDIRFDVTAQAVKPGQTESLLSQILRTAETLQAAKDAVEENFCTEERKKKLRPQVLKPKRTILETLNVFGCER